MNINDLMTDDLSKINEFAAACDDMMGSRYILAESKIIKILQSVATSTVLLRIMEGALKGFDYAATARKWGSGELAFPLPAKDHIALTLCLLSDIDNRKIFLNDFLRKFFWKGDINSSYTSFCATLIQPFKQYVVSAPDQAARERTEVRYADTSSDAVEFSSMRLAEAIERYNGFVRREKDEYIYMCDSIASKARTDTEGARSVASTLRKMLENVRELEPFVNDVAEALGC